MSGMLEHIERAERAAQTERWLPVVGFEGMYEVNNRGQVRSLDRVVSTTHGPSHRRGKLLKQSLCRPNQNGRWTVWLSRDGKDYAKRVHVLMLEAFVGPRPEGYLGCHNDGNRDNNTLANLRWDTASSNGFDRVRHGNHFQTHKTHCPKGHPYDERNTVRRDGDNRRRCLICTREIGRLSTRRAAARRKALRALESPTGPRLKSHCRHGHALAGDNLYVSPRGIRGCRICRREASLRSRKAAGAS